MKKIIMTIALIGCQSSFAYISGKTPTDEQDFYCPKSVSCSSDKITSCKFDSKDEKYFGKLTQTGAILTSNTFSGAKTSFHVNAIYGVCSYQGINLEIKPDANLQAFYKNPPASAWTLNGSIANCSASDTLLCPLKQRRGIVIHNVDLPDGVLASTNLKDISRLITTATYVSVLFDDVLVGCSSQKECTVDLLSKNHAQYGSVVIDMDTMNVIQTNSLDKTIEINKIDLFNIEMKKTDRERAVYCPSDIACTNSNINSCTFDSVDTKYFASLDGKASNKPETFKFHSAHYSNDGTVYVCEYHSLIDTLILRTKIEAFINPYDQHPDSLWKMIPWKNECVTPNSKSCPFKKSFGFIINNTNIPGGIIVSVKDKDIQKYPIAGRFLVKYDDATFGCNGEKECAIDLLSNKHVKYGSVTIDMNTMKVLNTNSLYSGYIDINQMDDDFYSAAEIGYVSR